MSIKAFSAITPTQMIVSALKEDGAGVINKLASVSLANLVAHELEKQLHQEGNYAQCDFNGYKTLRLSAILAHSVHSAELIGHDKVLEVVDEILLPHCINYRIGSTTAIKILPGEKNQSLHQDDSIYPIQIPGIERQVGVMWALTDFTKRNGATRIITQSHRDILCEGMPCTKTTQKPMRKGSVLLYLGSTIHGGGANFSPKARLGLITTYALGWLRQEVNQYLTIPKAQVQSYPAKIQRLIGYQSHGVNLGKFPEAPDGGWFLKKEGKQI